MLSLIVLNHRQRNFWNITTVFSWPYRVMLANQAQFGNQAYSAGRTLYSQGKPVVRFQKFLLLCFKTIKLSIKIYMRYLGTIFIHFDPIGTQCIVYIMLQGATFISSAIKIEAAALVLTILGQLQWWGYCPNCYW